MINLERLHRLGNKRVTNGRPSYNLTDKQWQKELNFRRLYITPHDRKITKMSGKFSREGNLHNDTDKTYDGISNWQSYCSFINDILKNIGSGGIDYCYYGYQVMELLKFHYNNLRTKYMENDGCWMVWLERR